MLEINPEAAASVVEMKKGQKLDEGVPRAPDQRSRLKLLESASPIAFAGIRIMAKSMRRSILDENHPTLLTQRNN